MLGGDTVAEIVSSAVPVYVTESSAVPDSDCVSLIVSVTEGDSLTETEAETESSGVPLIDLERSAVPDSDTVSSAEID